jgi:hypothetical protein
MPCKYLAPESGLIQLRERKGDTGRARIELNAVIESGGRLAEEAARLLELIAKSPSR